MDDFFKLPEFVRKLPSIRSEAMQPFYYHYDEAFAVDSVSLTSELVRLSNEHDLIVVEGNMLTELPDVYPLFDDIVFVTLTEAECASRRKKRSYDPPDQPGYFESVVWPQYVKHVDHALSMKQQGFNIQFIDGTAPLENNLQIVFETVENSFIDLIRIQCDPIETTVPQKFVTQPSCGAIATFIGIILLI